MLPRLLTRREALGESAALAAALLTAALPASEEAAPKAADWPMANGPTGNFNPRRYGHALVDDLAKARLLWKSADNDAGFAKGSVSGYLANLLNRPAHPGSCSGPIVADGKVFVASFRPAGDVWAENLPQLKVGKKEYKGAELEKLKKQLRIDADDLLLAVDQKTGKTAWKAVEEKKGLNRYMGKREGFAVTPAWSDGRVFSMGTTGRLYAYDSATGKKLWEKDVGKAHAAAEAHKKKCLAGRVLPGGMGWGASLVVAGGVLVAPLFDGRDVGLRGVDARTGKTLWEVAGACTKYATPAVFRPKGGGEYVLAANLQGEMRLIDPKTGKVLWKVTGLAPTYFPLAPSEERVLVNAGSKTAGGKRMAPYGLLAAYAITAKGAERAWAMPDKKEFWFENHMDSCAMRRVLVRDGRVYYLAQNKAGEKATYFSILDEKTGKVLHTGDEVKGGPLMYLIEDRLLHAPDAAHGDRLTLELFTADTAKLRRLCDPWKPPQETTTAYEVPMEIPYVDGCLFMRTITGEVRCYDLRKKGGAR